MKQIIRLRWTVAVIWIIIAVGLFIFAPNLQELVREKGQISAPEGSASMEASKLLKKMSTEYDEHTHGAVLVFHEDKKMTGNQRAEVESAIDALKNNNKELAVTNILDFRDDPAIASQTVAEDGKTIIVPFDVSFKNQDIEESKAKINSVLKDIEVQHFLTGEEYINQDIITNSEEGLKKTEIITVGLILIILFAVFRSVVAPFIPLLTVGISYLAAQGIVSILADTVDFPLSTFTQIFMVAVMFGIGTDYCILIISRFKEELTETDSVKEAVIATYQGAGKTIIYASLAVLIGFSTIGLSTFSLYQSAVAVAVGVAVVLLALLTLVPFFLAVLGKKIFWPFNKQVEHKESKIWGAAGHFAWTRPIIAIVIILVITLPTLLTYDASKSYDSLAEIGDNYDSVKGFNAVADSFGPGQTMPTSVVLKTNNKMERTKDFQDIEKISAEIAKMKGVKEVRSATRPSGEVIEDFLMDNQTELLADGIGKSADGLKEIQMGLHEAATELEKSNPQLDEAKDGVNQLMSGTNDAKEGIGDLKSALTEIQKGIQAGSAGAGEVKKNLQTIKTNLDKTITGNKQLLGGYKAITKGLEGFGNIDVNFDNLGNTEELDQLIATLEGAIENVEFVHKKAIDSDPSLQTNQAYMTAYQTAHAQISGSIKGVTELKKQLDTITKQVGKLGDVTTQLKTEVVVPLNELNKNFATTISGQEELANGIGQLISGIDELQGGLNEAANGQGQVAGSLPSLQEGLAQIYGGQKELKTAFSEMQDQLTELSDGLSASSVGLSQIHDGLNEVKNYLGEFDIDTTNPIVVIPDEALENEDFIEGIKPYLSDDKTITKLDVVLDINPYSTTAIKLMDQISQKVDDVKQGTTFENSTPKLGGVTSTNNDLQKVSDEDYSRTAILMIIGIFIILVILLKSITMPLYLIGSLLVTYFTSMAFAEFIFVTIGGHDGLTWAVPFFAFVILMALGIDYSIFLMDRFNEYRNGDMKVALLSAMKNMGTVIISAAVILGGTFSAMLPSGVLSILQIATVVITGLFLYAFIMLPLFIPVMVRLFGKANWWPFIRKS